MLNLEYHGLFLFSTPLPCSKTKKAKPDSLRLTEFYFLTFFNPIFEYKIGRGREPERATEPPKERTNERTETTVKLYIVGGKVLAV